MLKVLYQAIDSRTGDFDCLPAWLGVLGFQPPFRSSMSGRFGYFGILAIAWVLLIASPILVAQDLATNSPPSHPDSMWKNLGLPEPDPSAPYATPPQLELLFDDHFLQDTKSDYDLGGKENQIAWASGCVTLQSGAKLSRRIDAENWVVFEFACRFPELTEDGQKSELRILLEQEPASSGYLSLRQTRRAGKTESEIALYETPNAAGANGFRLPQKVHSEIYPEAFSTGNWKITYSGGVWLIEGSHPEMCWPSTESSDFSRIRTTALVCQGQPLELTRLAVHRASHRTPASVHGKNNDDPADPRTPNQRLSWDRAQQLSREVPKLVAQQQHEQVAPLLREWLSIQLQEVGLYHPTTANCLNYQALLLDSLGRVADSLAVREEALRLCLSIYPVPHRNIATAHNNLGDAYKMAGDLPKALVQGEKAVALFRKIYSGDHPELAGAINNLATIHEALGKWTEVENQYAEVVNMLRRLYGEDHVYLAIALNNLAQVRTRLGKGADAEILYTESLAILRRQFPGDDFRVALSLHNLAHLRAILGKGAEAEPQSVEALAMFKRIHHGDHPNIARATSTLAFVYDSLGKQADAEIRYDEALQMIRRLYPGDHPDLALALNNLADVRRSLGREADAEHLFSEALAIRRRLFPGDHPDVAASIENLAMAWHSLGRSVEAEPMCVESLAMYRRVLPEAHPNIARSLHNLATVREALGQVPTAIELHNESLTMLRRIYPDDHPSVAQGLESLAGAYQSIADLEAAARLATEAVSMNRRLYPASHPNLASSLVVLAAAQRALGRFEDAIASCEEAVAISSRLLENAASMQSEAMQLAMAARAKKYLMTYLSVVLLATDKQGAAVPDALVEQTLRLKGAVFMRQRWARLAQTETDAKARPILAQLQNVAARLGHLQRNPPVEPDRWNTWREQMQLAQDEFTDLQQQLSAASTEYRALQRANQTDWREIQTQLGDDVALVDLHEYWPATTETPAEGGSLRRSGYAAMILRQGHAPRLVELGFCSEIDHLVSKWRETRGSVSGELDAGSELRRMLWEPLLPHLEQINTVLVSPAGSTSLLPWSALPGKASGTYLLEEYAIAVVPVPQLLGNWATKTSNSTADPNMFVVADIDYGAEPGAMTTAAPSNHVHPNAKRSATPRATWNPLPSARIEAIGVRDSFERAFPAGEFRWLRGPAATEQGARQGLEHSRYIHLVTHGFFDEPTPTSVRDLSRGDETTLIGARNFGRMELDPLLFSGLVFAGANRATAEGQDDGILLAIDISVLDLRNAELAVLSACETGLGREASGEGVLGLQRAFQVAGAATTVTSLWKVDDAATQQLMNMFYENLWHGGMSKIEALRQAQLSMLRDRRSRGGEDELPEQPSNTTTESWAAWVLSGEWR